MLRKYEVMTTDAERTNDAQYRKRHLQVILVFHDIRSKATIY